MGLEKNKELTNATKHISILSSKKKVDALYTNAAWKVLVRAKRFFMLSEKTVITWPKSQSSCWF